MVMAMAMELSEVHANGPLDVDKTVEVMKVPLKLDMVSPGAAASLRTTSRKLLLLPRHTTNADEFSVQDSHIPRGSNSHFAIVFTSPLDSGAGQRLWSLQSATGAKAFESHRPRKRDAQSDDRQRSTAAKYRLSLFADAPEVELIWQGKTNDVTNVVLPFQSIEQIDEPRTEVHSTTEKGMGMLDLFSLDRDSGRQTGGWTNKLIWGDNKLVLSSLKNGPLRREIEAAGGLKLIYIDPPFDVGADFSSNVEIGDVSLSKESSILEDLAYRDTWGKGIDSYVAMMFERLIIMRDLMHENGSVFIHLGPGVSHLIRACAEEVFGATHLQNEIVWIRADPHNDAKKQLGNVTDRLVWLGKSETPFYNNEIEREELSASAEKEYSLLELPDGRVIN
jgi:DNA methylase